MATRLAIREKQLATWTAIIQECRNSGMKTKDWLAENNISKDQYCKWRGRTKSWTKRRRPTMYTLEQKQEAIDVYLQVNSIRKTIQLLGYPGARQTLKKWINEYKTNGKPSYPFVSQEKQLIPMSRLCMQ